MRQQVVEEVPKGRRRHDDRSKKVGCAMPSPDLDVCVYLSTSSAWVCTMPQRKGGRSRPSDPDGHPPLESGRLNSCKSNWLLERERIMAEWGAFALSGLVLEDA